MPKTESWAKYTGKGRGKPVGGSKKVLEFRRKLAEKGVVGRGLQDTLVDRYMRGDYSLPEERIGDNPREE